ncbi:amidase domain-containing protein [Kroppenstedtia eburnea]|uniref:amidase domain-containing protein n=1 Tax=Kroppenstedtia eburnea TaxID=714067 RepID=UPI001562A1B1|nr:amidase domain-containing protein [Kroppenstedtia eburnea]QKI81539.1 hypothetical protein GXN75_05750 [Kroppenstedtia eburnea]
MDEKRKDRKRRSKAKVIWISGITATALVVGSLAYAGAFESDKKPTADKPSATEQTQVAADDLTTEELADMPDKELVDNVSYYNEISASKEQIVQQNQKAIYIVKQKTGNPSIKPNLDDKKFRDHVKAAATNLDQLTPQEKQEVTKLVKDVGKYENKVNNKRIRELTEKAKTKGLTKDERMELINLQPIKNPGSVLKPDKGIEEPEKQQPPKDQPSKEQPPAEQPGDKPGKEQPPAEQPGDKPGKEQPPAEQPGDKPGKEQPPAEQPGDKPGKEQPPAEQPGDKPGKEQPPAEQPGDESDQEQPPAEQPGEQPGKEQPPAEQPKDDQNKLETEKNGYNRKKAVDYAYKWWNKRNNAEYGYYSRVNGGCAACWYDCTNFVSQVIKTGGIKEKVGRYDWYDYWFYNDKQPGLSWAVAHSFYKHMDEVRKPQKADYVSQLKAGDIISVDFEGDGSIDHSVVVTKIKNGRIYATYHTSDNKDKDVTDWLTEYKVYAFKMETVKN